MRCKKHLQLQDLTSTIGVCASCLRERLQPLLAAQDQAQAQAQAQSERLSNSYIDNNPSRRKPKGKPEENPPPANPEENPPPAMPEENPPYLTHRKSDCEPRRERLFFGTPEVSDGGATAEKRRHGGRFWILSNIFRGRSNKTESLHEDPCNPPPSGLATILPVHRHARYRTSTGGGLSPLKTAENLGEFSAEVDTAEHDRSDSGNSSKSSPSKQNSTPGTTHRRSRIGNAGKGLTSIVFCLTPLVRASPNRHWSHKGMGHENGAGGVHHISNAPSFCPNRSRKLADFGKSAHNR